MENGFLDRCIDQDIGIKKNPVIDPNHHKDPHGVRRDHPAKVPHCGLGNPMEGVVFLVGKFSITNTTLCSPGGISGGTWAVKIPLGSTFATDSMVFMTFFKFISA